MSDLGPDDFAALRRRLAKRWKPITLGNFIQRVRVVFKHAADNDLIDRPVRYGQGFKRPSSEKTIRRNAEFAVAVDQIGATDPAKKEEILSGTSGQTKHKSSAPELLRRFVLRAPSNASRRLMPRS